MIRIKNVTKYYKDQNPALKNVTFELQPGAFCYIKGKSGAGKSTLFRLLTAEEKADQGTIEVAGYNLRTMDSNAYCNFRKNIGVIYQDYKLLERYTIFENLAYPLQILGESLDSINKKIHEVLALIDLLGKENLFPEQMSGGEQQRVAIGRAVITNSSLLLADEPTGNLDPKNTRKIMELFEKIHSRGTTIVMSTHDETIVSDFPHSTVFLESGTLLSNLMKEDL